MALSVGIPVMFDLDVPIVPGKYTKRLFDFIDGLPAGTRLYLSFDYDPRSMPEIHPTAVAILVQAFKKGLKPICGANWPAGGDMAEQALATAIQVFREKQPKASIADLKKGRDYVNLGFKPGGLINIKRFSRDFTGSFPADKEGVKTSELNIFRNSGGREFSIKDIGIIVSFSSGYLGIEDFIYASGDHGRPMGTACTSVNIPMYYTYLQTGQLVGMAGGMPGAAEYERLLGYRGEAGKGMGPQSFAHLVIMLLIILGNLP